VVDYQALSIIFAGLSIAASIVYYASVLQNANRTQQMQLETRQAQLFMQIISTYHSEEYIKAFSEIMMWEYDSYDDYMAKYGSEVNPEAYMMYRKVFGYLEGIGVLVRRGLIDPSLVDDLMSGAIQLLGEV
jgi:ribosomal protein S8